MKKKKPSIQYTIRQVPEEVDAKLRELAVFHDLDSLAGSWVEDKAFDQAVGAFEQVDEDLWK